MQTHLCRCFVTHPLEPACRWTLHRMQTHLCRCFVTHPLEPACRWTLHRMQIHLCRCFVTHPLEPACRWTLHRMQTHLCRCDNTDPWVYQPRQSRSRPGSDILEDHILPGRPREMEIKSVTLSDVFAT